MMLFSSFCLPSFIFFVVHSYRPTAAAALAVSPVKPRALDQIECSGKFPIFAVPFLTLNSMCTIRAGHPGNMGCECIGSVGHVLVCGTSHLEEIRRWIDFCYLSCSCGDNTLRVHDQPTVDLDKAPGRVFGVDPNGRVYEHPNGRVYKPKPRRPISYRPHSGNNPTGSTHTCSGTCTSVDRGCDWASTGDCKCFAPPVGLFFWHIGDCGTRLPFKAKRDLAQQRHSYYLNATAQFASSGKVTTPAGSLPDHAAQLASGLLPSPCNVSYVSFACADSTDGIVHEPPQNWLGALLPENAKELPPVPEEFLRIHGGKGKLQVVLPAVD